MDLSVKDLWNEKANLAVYNFAEECAKLKATNPFERNALDNVINTLMTELWDRCFSQTEIRNAFNAAIADMPRYAAGEEKRG